MRLATVALPDGKLWVRITRPHHEDPYDPSWAQRYGGRWNPPNSFATLYLNADVATARRQIERLLEDTVVAPDDLTGDAYELVGAYLPDAQVAADVVVHPPPSGSFSAPQPQPQLGQLFLDLVQ